MIRKILNTGIRQENESTLNRKIRLSNFISVFTLIACAINLPVYLYFKMYLLLSSNCVILAICFTTLFLHHKGRHLLAFNIMGLAMTALMDVISLCFGLQSNLHFFLICTCMTAVVFFSGHTWLRNINITFAVASFFFVLFYLQNNPTLMTLPENVVNMLTISGYVNFLTLFIFTVIFFSFFVKQNDNFQEELSRQNVILEHKNSQIIDSIEYAKHIQEAMLPTLGTVKSYFKESFVFYKPKDIVAGDFYWINPLPDGSVLFAAADSTGHGVPGAMVSVICTNALNRAVNEFGLTAPGEILDKARLLIADCFEKSGQNVKDGMDISLCLFNPQTNNLKWSGANNPLWIINSRANEITVVKPDKQTVGSTFNPQPFKTHEVQLEKGDCFYLFTDGYADQFGGLEAKKFMQKRMKELLLKICKMPMEFQHNSIHENLLQWMGNQEQVDDICFAGIKI